VSGPAAGGPAPATASPAPAPVLVRLVWRLVVAQAVAAAAVGLPFSRRNTVSVLITLSLVTVCCLLALLVRGGTRGAWLTALGTEATFFVFGLAKFLSARYVGGTLFALIITVTLLQPAVARAFGAQSWRLSQAGGNEPALGSATEDAYGEQAAR
jgi:hypothetical protein